MIEDALQSPRAIRDEAALRARDAVGADEVFFVKYVSVGGVHHYSGFTGALSPEAREVFARLDGRPTLVDDWWRPSDVPEDERDQFQQVNQVLSAIERRQARIYREMYGPLEITRSCRTRLFDGRRFLGYLGCIRRGRGARSFTERELERLNRIAPALKSEIIKAERLERLPDGRACALFDPEKRRLEWASGEVRRWFDARRLDRLVAAAELDELPEYVVVDGHVLWLTQMTGEAGQRLMVMPESGEEVVAASDVDPTVPSGGAVGEAWMHDLESALDRLPSPALLVDADMTVVAVNRRADALVGAVETIAIRDGKLELALASDNARLRDLVAQVQSPDACEDGPAANVSVRRCGRLPVELLVSRFSSRDDAGRERALLLVYDPEARPRIRADVLERLFDLTMTEAFVAARLAEGRSIAEIAEMRRCTAGTVRTHVKSVFRKTGTNRQGELVQVILTSPAVALDT